MRSLHHLLGLEQDLDHVCYTLRRSVDKQNSAAVGAVHVTCSDESERESIEAFQRAFVEPLLPALKLWSKCPFRTSNLGGRYEWGAIRIAEQHFATARSRGVEDVRWAKMR